MHQEWKPMLPMRMCCRRSFMYERLPYNLVSHLLICLLRKFDNEIELKIWEFLCGNYFLATHFKVIRTHLSSSLVVFKINFWIASQCAGVCDSPNLTKKNRGNNYKNNLLWKSTHLKEKGKQKNRNRNSGQQQHSKEGKKKKKKRHTIRFDDANIQHSIVIRTHLKSFIRLLFVFFFYFLMPCFCLTDFMSGVCELLIWEWELILWQPLLPQKYYISFPFLIPKRFFFNF